MTSKHADAVSASTEALELQFAFHVRDLHARGLTVELIAQRVSASVDDVLEAHRMMNLCVNDTDEPIQYRTDAERAAEFDKMPKRMQDRIKKAKGG